MSASRPTTPRWETRLRGWLAPEGAEVQARPQVDGWEGRLLTPMRDFVGAVLRQPPRPEVREELRARRSPRLPFSLHLALASRSVRLFDAGPIDDLALVQREGVSLHHDVEFFTRLDPEAEGSEGYAAYGVIRLYRRGHALPRLEQARAFWDSLRADFGLRAVPAAASLLAREGPAPSDGRRGPPKEWRLRACQPRAQRVFERVGMRRFYYGDLLDILRERLTPTQKVAWLEEAFERTPRAGEIVHRYYLMGDRQLYLVRHHWSRGKALLRAETNAAAQRLCVESGVFRRLRRVA